MLDVGTALCAVCPAAGSAGTHNFEMIDMHTPAALSIPHLRTEWGSKMTLGPAPPSQKFTPP